MSSVHSESSTELTLKSPRSSVLRDSQVPFENCAKRSANAGLFIAVGVLHYTSILAKASSHLAVRPTITERDRRWRMGSHLVITWRE